MTDFKALTDRIVVCAPASFPTFYDDDCTGVCEVCGARVRFRPHVPARRSLVCLLCFIVNADPVGTFEITPETLDELRALGLVDGGES